MQFVDEVVDLWQLSLHGLSLIEDTSLDWPGTMRTVLMGLHPRTDFSVRPNNIGPVADDKVIARLAARYTLCVTRFGHLRMQQLMDLQTLDDRVMRTVWEDGTTVVADFKDQRLEVNGETIDRPTALS
jgi:hypothetical protein